MKIYFLSGDKFEKKTSYNFFVSRLVFYAIYEYTDSILDRHLIDL